MLSKPIKRFRSRKEAKKTDNIFKKSLFAVRNFFDEHLIWPISSFFHTFKERFLRSLAWARLTWLNYDFDSVFLYEVMAFKLRRIYRALEKGCAVQKPEDMDALKELVQICDRLFNQEGYEDKYHKIHDKKWGKMQRWDTEQLFDKDGKPDGSRIIFKDRPKVKNKKQKEQERQEFLAFIDKAEVDRKSDIDRMAEILKKHARAWWD